MSWHVDVLICIAHSDARDGRFEKEWNRQCLGLAWDVTSAVDHFF